MTQSTEQERAHALAEKHGATSYRNRADTSNPAFGFALGQLEALISEVEQAARRAPVVAVPQGWKLVPEVLTPEMKRECMDSLMDGIDIYMNSNEQIEIQTDAPRRIWKFLLAAAPQPPEATVKDSLTVEAAPVQMPVPDLLRMQVAQEFLEWNRSADGGLVKQAYEYVVFEKVRQLLAAHGTQEQST